MRGLDVSNFRTASEKAARLRGAETLSVEQAQQLMNPDARVTLELPSSEALLGEVRSCAQRHARRRLATLSNVFLGGGVR